MDKRPYRIVGAFDTETTNTGNILEGFKAFPVLYQLGTFAGDITDVTPDKITVDCYREHTQLYKALDGLIEKHSAECVPVILVHNLGFDMYSLAPWFKGKQVQVLAKTAKKPITFKVLQDDIPAIVFLDTLGMFMKSLKTLGEECGIAKAVGDWDYSLIRAPQTPITTEEMNYAKRDIVTLLCYMAYFLKQNPDIDPAEIGKTVVTKTGIVRAKRMKHVGSEKGKRGKQKVRQTWHLLNQTQKPKSDDELFTMHAATRGGFTFCARNNASNVFLAKNDTRIISIDATSQHPAQMASHLYPQDFYPADIEKLQIVIETCFAVKPSLILSAWIKPFPFAFYGAFRFENIRPKEGTIYEREGIFTLASARLAGAFPLFDNEAQAGFKNNLASLGYKDSAEDARCAFGKLESAKSCILYLTELESWVLSRVYDFDKCEALGGYMSHTFRKPSDMSLLSVMRFYKAKNMLKEFMSVYEPGKANDARALKGLYPDSFIADCESGKADEQELKEYYQLSKADLNALFGIEATNECRRDFTIGKDGLVLTGTDGLHNMPKSPKCFYQYGQRIVGWSRVAQIVIMELIAPYVDHVICGDTDSLKIVYQERNWPDIEKALKKHARALDKAKNQACRRIRFNFNDLYDKLPGIGHYVFDGSYEGFSASWNKSYIGLVDGKCKATIAGVPTSRRLDGNNSFNDFCDDLIKGGRTFAEVAALAIGYNVVIHPSLTKLNGRLHPKFGDMFRGQVADYLGNTYEVEAPACLALFAMPKTIGDTRTPDNHANMQIALQNNPSVNVAPVMLRYNNGVAEIE